ncbi:MAG: T9SS type A sorting domain-containing protein [Saprospiraceae bacterium]|nr:T9SS type A sorting domain-containing protein [Saprospiraceae bacterium]
MRRKFTLIFTMLMILGAGSLRAQLAPGSIAPNFTGTDILGETWTLYDALDQGKTAIIEIVSTQDDESWNYHSLQTLQNLYAAYGPTGTDEMVVFLIEGDADTNTDCLFGAPGCVGGTIGDWVTGTLYPIIDDASIAETYEISSFPTIYHICANRIVNEIGQVTSVPEIYGFNSFCEPVNGSNNASILAYNGFEGIFCQEATFAPSALFQNMGADEITSASFALSIDGAPFTEKNWVGSLNTYQLGTITFEEITLSSSTNFSISVTSVNGVADDDAGNNLVTAQVSLAIDVNNTLVTLEYTTDDYPEESYWELLDANDQILYSGGNPGIFTGQDGSDIYVENTAYTLELALPSDGCYRFVTYDRFGDGMCCQYGDGSYVLRDAAGTVMFSGGEFEFIAEHPFEVKNASPVVNNARIAVYEGERGEYCQVLTFTPNLVVQNLGSNEITALTIEVTGAGSVQTFEWTGNLASSNYELISLDELVLSGAADLTFTITEVNGEADDYAFGNQYGVPLVRVPGTEYQTVSVRIVTDEYGYETYWQITDDAGTVIAEGGNELVGPDGGGLRVASEGDPGAYGQFETIDVQVDLPAEGCYNFLIVDDYGDGICCEYGDGLFRVSDQDNVVVATGDVFDDFLLTAFEVEVIVGVKEFKELGDLMLFPNPVRDELMLNFDLTTPTTLQLSVRNALGQLVQTVATDDFTAGKHTLRIPVSTLSDGVYLLTFSNGAQATSRRFVVQH